jgi:hypothetical protein
LFYRVRDLPRRRSPECRSTHGRFQDWSPALLGVDGEPPFTGCRSQRAATLLRTDTGRVFHQYAPWVEFSPEFGGAAVTHVYACLFARPKRRVDLGRDYDDAAVELPRLAGTLLAYAQVGCGLGGCQATIRIRDLAAGGMRGVSPVQQSNYYGPFGVGDLVLKENGSLAWTVARRSWTDSEFVAYEVWALDSRAARLLDSGPNLDLESLKLNGSTLIWTNGGTTRTDTLE